MSKIPLVYIVCNTVAIVNDPVAPATWPSKVDELIGHAPHGDAVDNYLTDNVKVCEKISTLTHSHECWTYVHPTQHNRNNHLAYMALKNHYLGPNNMNHQANEAKTKLKDSSYHGERCHWNFEKYVCMHQDQHTILQGLVEHGYAGIDKCSKVHHLLDGIKTNEFDTAKGKIWASPRLQAHFDECVTLFQDFINNKKTATSHTVTIALVGMKCQQDNEEEGGDIQPDMSIEDRYYTGKEYIQLSKVKKFSLKIKCQKHGHNTGSKNRSKSKHANKTNDQASDQVIKALTKVLEQNDAEEGTSSDADNDTPAPKNHTNKALQ